MGKRVLEKVEKGALFRSREGISPLPSYFKEQSEVSRRELCEVTSPAYGPVLSQGSEAGRSPRCPEARSPPRVSHVMSGEAHIDDEDEQEKLDPDIEVADLLVKSAIYGVDIAKQSLRNAIDVKAQQAKERVVGKGNNLLGSKPVPGRGGIPRRGGYGGRGGRFINRPSYSDVVRGSHHEEEGQSSGIPVEKPQSPGSLANRSNFGQLNLVEGGGVQSESNEDWTQVGKDKGKSPMQAFFSPDKREDPVPSSAAEQINLGSAMATTLSDKENLPPDIKFLEEKALSEAREQTEYQSDSEDVSMEVWDASGGVNMDDFDSPVAKKTPPGKISVRSPPSKNASMNEGWTKVGKGKGKDPGEQHVSHALDFPSSSNPILSKGDGQNSEIAEKGKEIQVEVNEQSEKSAQDINVTEEEMAKPDKNKQSSFSIRFRKRGF
ncbi:hypothetical protein U1Q18_040516 [Sarracenia purpurea var. burkii]